MENMENMNMDNNKIKILVVDDEEDILSLVVEELLELFKGKVQVETATCGKQAISMMSDNKYDVVLTDLGLPDKVIDGFCVAKVAKEAGCFTAIITGCIAKLGVGDIRSVDYVLRKPFNNDELRCLIELYRKVLKQQFKQSQDSV